MNMTLHVIIILSGNCLNYFRMSTDNYFILNLRDRDGGYYWNSCHYALILEGSPTLLSDGIADKAETYLLHIQEHM
jgi:hypothetical protein